jgi:hypothetical protein
MSPFRWFASLSILALAGVGVLGPAAVAGASAAPAHQGLLPPKNPGRSLSPSPDFLGSGSCANGSDTGACNTVVLKAIAAARKRLEHMGGMSFRLSAYEKLGPAEQLFVTVDLERVERGEAPAQVLTHSLDSIAQAGANADSDPNLQSVPHQLPGGGYLSGIGGNWAGGWHNALGADYAWTYDDGLGSGNGDCTAKNKSGCWGHRDNILGTFTSAQACGSGPRELAMGAGHVTSGKAFGDSESELFVGVCGPTPTDVVMSWTRVKALLHITT